MFHLIESCGYSEILFMSFREISYYSISDTIFKNSSLENLQLIESRYNDAKKAFMKLKKKAKIDDLKLKSFDEFIND